MAVVAAHAGIKATSHSKDDPTMPKPLAIIIEDDANLSRIFSLTIQTDFETEIYADGSVAYARIASAEPALVILDLHLPGKQGNDILAEIRATPRLAKTPVILCTADERRAETLYDEADIVLLKPVSPIQLRQIALRFLPN
jgi:DNA-binding response OmpR family regulator